MGTITGPGWLCQPVWPPGAIVMVWVTTWTSSRVESFRSPVWTLIPAGRVPTDRIVPTAPDPGVAAAIPIEAIAPTKPRTRARPRVVRSMSFSLSDSAFGREADVGGVGITQPDARVWPDLVR